MVKLTFVCDQKIVGEGEYEKPFKYGDKVEVEGRNLVVKWTYWNPNNKSEGTTFLMEMGKRKLSEEAETASDEVPDYIKNHNRVLDEFKKDTFPNER